MPILAAQRADTAVARDAENRGWTEEKWPATTRSSPGSTCCSTPTPPSRPGEQQPDERLPPADYVLRVENACAELATDGTPITFDAVAARAGIGRATLYRRPDLRAVIEDHRQQARTRTPSPAWPSRRPPPRRTRRRRRQRPPPRRTTPPTDQTTTQHLTSQQTLLDRRGTILDAD